MMKRGKIEKKCKTKNRGNKNRLLACLLTFLLIMAVGCGGNGSGESGSGASGGSDGVEALADVNEIPEDGVITKKQFQTIAGQDKQVQFTGQTADGISYVWTFDAAKIQNPADQNLKVDFTLEGLDDIKAKANNANDALKMTMYGEGLICVPTLKVTLPQAWESDTGLLLKEQNGNLAKMSDVTIETDKEKNTTVLTMNVSSLEGDCYLVGGISGSQNNGEQGTDNGTGSGTVSGSTGDSNSVSSSNSGNNSSSSGSDGDVKNSESAGTTLTCTVSIDCSTVLNNLDKLTAGKEEFVPSNGQILAPSTVAFTEGESAYDILSRVCKEAGIHMESTSTPGYDSDYIEGINQLYEFDCGEQSGWMFSVNGWFPNYGCSKYKVEDGDVIAWVYTCNLGKDVGDNSTH